MELKSMLRSEQGSSVIEATFVVSITLFVVFFMLILGFTFYQETIMQTVADNVSSSMARSYGYSHKDPFVSYIDAENVPRGFIDSSYWVFNSGSDEKEKNAKWMAQAEMNKYRFMSPMSNSQVLTAEASRSDIAWFQCEIEVTISEKYYIPFARFLGKEDSVIEFKTTSRAICPDYTAFYSYVNFLEDFTMLFSKANKNFKGLDDAVTNVTSIVNNIVSGTVRIIKDIQSGHFLN